MLVPQRPLFVQVFLRGGADGLSFLPPLITNTNQLDPQYVNRRTTTKWDPPLVSTNSALALAPSFGLAPRLAQLGTLFNENRLLFVHATGSNDATRSHFLQQDYVERAENTGSVLPTGSTSSIGTGWLARHLLTSAPGTGSSGNLRGLSLTANPVTSFRGATSTSTPNPATFTFPGTVLTPTREAALAAIYGNFGGGGSGLLVKNALKNDRDAIALLSSVNYTRSPSASVPAYLPGGIGNLLKTTADMAYAPATSNELEIVNIDMGGGWDTHFQQNTTGLIGVPGMGGLMGELSSALFSFSRDMDLVPSGRPYCVLVTTEFGRTTDENTSGGTDHGRGGVAIVLGKLGMLQQGVVHAPAWTGLPATGDLQVQTDIRHIQGEICQKVLWNNNLRDVLHDYPGGNGTTQYVYQSQNLLS